MLQVAGQTALGKAVICMATSSASAALELWTDLVANCIQHKWQHRGLVQNGLTMIYIRCLVSFYGTTKQSVVYERLNIRASSRLGGSS